MSHISKIELEVNDLECLKKACAFLGFTFVAGQTKYVWYGRVVNQDKYPLPEGLTETDLGKCTHAIKVPEAEYEIGVVKRNGKYLLLADFWDARLRTRIGDNGGRLKQAYAIERIKKEARKKNYRISEVKIDNGIRLELSLA